MVGIVVIHVPIYRYMSKWVDVSLQVHLSRPNNIFPPLYHSDFLSLSLSSDESPFFPHFLCQSV